AELVCTAAADAELAIETGDVIVIAQKLVSKAEGRVVSLQTVEPGDEAQRLAAETEKEPEVVQLILDQSRRILRHRPGVLIAEHKLGFVLANAGIDRSNVDADPDKVLLLPEDPDRSAVLLREAINSKLNVRIGIVIADSVGRAWRMGTTGMALGCAGVEALLNLRGHKDMFGRELQVSEHAVADSIASAAELLLGEADEAMPVVVVRGLDEGESTQDSTVLLRPEDEDMFR
ncbi:MAG: coenzyme F420-0:L-glutamate ligase, partial [Gammaproteobacteria bacterium]|nr:coenzyme F420-0:L-glutamate ligase [Gammaproteobacteria bacterium]